MHLPRRAECTSAWQPRNGRAGSGNPYLAAQSRVPRLARRRVRPTSCRAAATAPRRTALPRAPGPPAQVRFAREQQVTARRCPTPLGTEFSMATPEPDRILSTTPMTADNRWPPAQFRLFPVTHPRTNGTARSRPRSTLLSKSTSRGFSNASMPKVSRSPASSSKSSRRTSNAGASNTDSCASSAMPAGMRSWWRSVASAAA